MSMNGITTGSFQDLLGQYVDLSSLNGSQQGNVRCPFHPDRNPSLSVDFAKCKFHCFGCGVGGGLEQFRALVAKRKLHRLAAGTNGAKNRNGQGGRGAPTPSQMPAT